MVIYLPLLISIIGLIIYLATKPDKNPDVRHIGDVMFWTGLLAFLITYPHTAVSLFK